MRRVCSKKRDDFQEHAVSISDTCELVERLDPFSFPVLQQLVRMWCIVARGTRDLVSLGLYVTTEARADP